MSRPVLLGSTHHSLPISLATDMDPWCSRSALPRVFRVFILSLKSARRNVHVAQFVSPRACWTKMRQPVAYWTPIDDPPLDAVCRPYTNHRSIHIEL